MEFDSLFFAHPFLPADVQNGICRRIEYMAHSNHPDDTPAIRLERDVARIRVLLEMEREVQRRHGAAVAWVRGELDCVRRCKAVLGELRAEPPADDDGRSQSRVRMHRQRLHDQELAAHKVAQEVLALEPVRIEILLEHMAVFRSVRENAADDLDAYWTRYGRFGLTCLRYSNLMIRYPGSAQEAWRFGQLPPPRPVEAQAASNRQQKPEPSPPRGGGARDPKRERASTWSAVSARIREGRAWPAIECAVCLTDVPLSTETLLSDASEAHTGIRLACDHVFGRSCLETWQRGRPRGSCPMCRAAYDVRTLIPGRDFTSDLLLLELGNADPVALGGAR